MNEQLAQSETYQCIKCNQVFDTKQGLAVHKVRAHGQKKWASRPRIVTDDQIRERRRLYQKNIRERRRAMGLTSKGTPVKEPNHYTRLHRKSSLRTLPDGRHVPSTFGTKWTPERRRKQAATIRAKREARLNGLLNVHEEQPQNNAVASEYGIAADAIMAAANVLRAVRVGMKVTHQI